MATINCDMGEAFGLYRMGDDAGLMPLIDIANVACGFHASDFNHMRSTVRLAKAHGVAVGAHPSLPDLQGFGRREMKIGREELANCLIYQIGALKGFLDAEGMKLNHIKPHGSLYAMAAGGVDGFVQRSHHAEQGGLEYVRSVTNRMGCVFVARCHRV